MTDGPLFFGEAMKFSHCIRVAAIASVFGVAGTAFAADAGVSTAQAQTGPSPGGSVQNYVPPGPASVGGTERVDNSNGVPLSEPARVYAQQHGGHLPPTVVVDHAGRAWDVVGAEPADAGNANSSTVIFLRPHGEGEVAVVPGGETVYTVPDDADDVTVMRVLPDGTLYDMDVVPPEGPGGMQSTPGYMGPGSDKGQ
jgi:hypothetical protein